MREGGSLKNQWGLRAGGSGGTGSAGRARGRAGKAAPSGPCNATHSRGAIAPPPPARSAGALLPLYSLRLVPLPHVPLFDIRVRDSGRGGRARRAAPPALTALRIQLRNPCGTENATHESRHKLSGGILWMLPVIRSDDWSIVNSVIRLDYAPRREEVQQWAGTDYWDWGGKIAESSSPCYDEFPCRFSCSAQFRLLESFVRVNRGACLLHGW